MFSAVLLHLHAWTYGGQVGLHDFVCSEAYSVCCQGYQQGENYISFFPFSHLRRQCLSRLVQVLNHLHGLAGRCPYRCVRPGFDLRWCHVTDFKNSILVVTLPDTKRHGISARTGWPRVCIVCLGEIATSICSFSLIVAARKNCLRRSLSETY